MWPAVKVDNQELPMPITTDAKRNDSPSKRLSRSSLSVSVIVLSHKLFSSSINRASTFALAAHLALQTAARGCLALFAYKAHGHALLPRFQGIGVIRVFLISQILSPAAYGAPTYRYGCPRCLSRSMHVLTRWFRVAAQETAEPAARYDVEVEQSSQSRNWHAVTNARVPA
jgi:hypothetical protein